MQALYDVAAPAKLNLFLHVTGQRADGYHLLQSVFMLLDWHDLLHFELRSNSPHITRQDLSTPLPVDDLIVRAAHALQAATGCTMGAHISIQKNLPAQAGLGGGSSDAASTLLALNRLWRLSLSRTQLQTIGLRLGADVPFFLCGSNAWVEGIGERITPLTAEQQPPPGRFVIVKPPAGLHTKEIFSHPLLQRHTNRAIVADFAKHQYQFGRNDLQAVAEMVCPEVLSAIVWLESKGLNPRMTGSGTAVFAKISNITDFQDAPSNWQVKICDNTKLHSLNGWAA